MSELSGSQPVRIAPGSAAPTDRVSGWLRLLDGVRVLYASLEGVGAPFGLMLRDYELLRCLPGRALSQSAIVRQLECSKVSVSRGVRRLSARGWIEVTGSPVDKRVTTVALTEGC